MRFFSVAFLAAALACAAASTVQQVWTLNELDAALQNPNTDPALVPYLAAGLNEIMSNLMSGQQVTAVTIDLPVSVAESASSPAVAAVVPVESAPATVDQVMSLHELSTAIQDPSTDAALLPYLIEAFEGIMEALMAGEQVESAVVSIPTEVVASLSPVVDISPVVVEISESEAVQVADSAASPALVEVAETVQVADSAPALSEVAETVQVADSVDSAAPALVEIPTPAAVVESEVAAAPSPVPTSPLVQIVININNEQAADQVIGVAPAQIPEIESIVNPIDVVAVAAPEVSPVAVVDAVEAASNPIDVIAVAAPEVAPVAVVDVVEASSPIDVIAVAAPEVSPVAVVDAVEASSNPIDVIAVAAPEASPVAVVEAVEASSNPIDVIAVSAPEASPASSPIDIIAVSAPETEAAPVVGIVDAVNPVIIGTPL